MDRQQIIAQINELRIAEKMSWWDFSMATQMQVPSLTAIIRDRPNSFADTLLTMLFDGLNAWLIIQNSEKTFNIYSYSQLEEWAIYTRERSKMTIQQFAGAVGLSRNSVSKYLLGKAKMRIDTVLKWAEVTGYTVTIGHTPHPDIK